MAQNSLSASLFSDKPLGRNLLLFAALAACAMLLGFGLDHHARLLWCLRVAVPIAALAPARV